uniref:[Pyruvate dehydrogenase [acetyl-transferring]]-phosphatase 1, mitochondrial n=1 Tax=Petromyzon marinus TaxID=7757 RepID=A0AAJ7WZY8_PETMA|nr:pyruvate dehydrogenase [acetyl-transferring]-phosphatase 1, mitochondrial-like [Petromyzon marinus]
MVRLSIPLNRLAPPTDPWPQLQGHLLTPLSPHGGSHGRVRVTLAAVPNSTGTRTLAQRGYISLPAERKASPPLNPEQVDGILRTDEFECELEREFRGGTVLSLHSNQLAANTPVEDRRTAATCLHTGGLLVGVFDGHGGSTCAQAVSERLFGYVASALLPQHTLLNLEAAAEAREAALQEGGWALLSSELGQAQGQGLAYLPAPPELLRWHGPAPGGTARTHYSESLRTFWQELIDLDNGEGLGVRDALITAFKRLDSDISLEAQVPWEHPSLARKARRTAFSGCTACVAHVHGPDLHVANVGDSRAVLGVRRADGSWSALSLTNDHSAQNEKEVARLRAEHPMKERKTVVRGGRLLGLLMPTRAFGDVRFKWSVELQRRVLDETGYAGRQYFFPPNYHTPPYLTAKPEITHHRLRPQDEFVVLATDGLWEVMHRQEVVRLVGEHLDRAPSRPAHQPLPRGRPLTLADMLALLQARKAALAPTDGWDRNPATLLVRHAVGRGEWGGVEPDRLARMLALPEDMARLHRDDITLTVLRMDTHAAARYHHHARDEAEDDDEDDDQMRRA